MKKQNRLCALYGRVSTQRQAVTEDGGLDTQFSLMEKQVDLENEKDPDTEWTIVARYREEGRSGKNLDRPEYERMLSDIREGKVNTVVVYKIDRITRSLRDFYVLWETFKEHKVEFISLHEMFDSTNAVGRAMLKLILVFAELKREQTAERTTATMLYRAQQGLWNGGRRFGYDLDPDNKGVLKVNSVQKEILIRDFFEKCVEEGSAGKVVKHLDEQGIHRPKYVTKRTKETRGGGKFYKQAVVNILTDKVFIGKIEFKGEVYEGQHEAIVDEALFNRVQAIIAKNRINKGNCKSQGEHVYLLQGLVRCGKCGSMLTPSSATGRGRKRHFYYNCTKKSHSNRTECDARYLPAVTAEEFVLEQISKWASNRDEINRAVAEASGYREEEITSIGVQLQGARDELLTVNRKLSNLVALAEDGKDFNAIESRIGELDAAKENLQRRIERLELEREDKNKEVLSGDVVAETYCDFPFIVEKLKDQGKLHDLKEILSNYIEVIDVHQDEDDPSSGHMKIMMFETEIPGSNLTVPLAEVSEHEKTPRETVLTTGFSERMERLPR